MLTPTIELHVYYLFIFYLIVNANAYAFYVKHVASFRHYQQASSHRTSIINYAKIWWR